MLACSPVIERDASDLLALPVMLKGSSHDRGVGAKTPLVTDGSMKPNACACSETRIGNRRAQIHRGEPPAPTLEQHSFTIFAARTTTPIFQHCYLR